MALRKNPAADRRAERLNMFIVRIRQVRDVLPASEPGDNSLVSLARRLLDEAFAELEE